VKREGRERLREKFERLSPEDKRKSAIGLKTGRRNVKG
jgi:hypothetical protein